LGHLLDRFDLEFFGVTLTTHGTSYLGLIMRLGGVYETRGDSVKPTIGNKNITRRILINIPISLILRVG
ncbi:hypothetical protein LJG08_33845, partial [Pseudomonas aeruginosa]|nr:hypothetical protein [Pseudomonas aeruginosa]